MDVCVLLVDEQELVRPGLRALLGEQAELHVVAEASDGLEAIAGSRETKPDVVLMDVSRLPPPSAERENRPNCDAARRGETLPIPTEDILAQSAPTSAFMPNDLGAASGVAAIME